MREVLIIFPPKKYFFLFLIQFQTSMKKQFVGKRPKRTGQSKSKKPKVVADNQAMRPMPRNRQEMKHVDLPPATYLINTTPVFTLLNTLYTGSETYRVEGNRCKAKYLHFTGFVFPIRTRASSDYARILLVWLGAPRGAAPSIASILSSTDYTGAITSSSSDFPNPTNRAAVKLLADIRLALPPVTVTAGVLTNNAATIPNVNDRYQFERFIRLNDAMVEADQGFDGTIGPFTTGAIYAITIGSVASGSEGYSVSYAARFAFTE